MIAFEQKSFPWIKTRIDWESEDLLRYQFCTLNKKVDYVIPLSSIYQEPMVASKTSSVAAIITFVALGLMFCFGIDYFKNPTEWENIGEIITAELSTLLIAVISGIYFWNSTRRRLLYYFKDMETVAFWFFDKPDKQIKEFKETLIQKSLRATVSKDKDNINLLKKEISRLTGEKLIRKEFENELYDRIEYLENSQL